MSGVAYANLLSAVFVLEGITTAVTAGLHHRVRRATVVSSLLLIAVAIRGGRAR